jgi:DegV family protein with EDD domain
MATSVVSDTTGYITPEILEQYGIAEVSLYVTLQGTQQREADITDYGEFYERLAASGESVTTSQPSVGDFISVYEPLLEEGHDVVSVHISASISGTYEAALQAKQRRVDEARGGERIAVVNSRSAAGGHAMIVLAAARAATAGASADEAAAAAERSREGLMIWFALDTLEYLRRGGRVGAAGAMLGSALKIKPILTFGEEITPVERVRTTSRARERLRDLARAHFDAGYKDWVVQHIREQEQADRLVEDCREIFGSEPALVSEVGPVLGAHGGPGMLGIGACSLPPEPA